MKAPPALPSSASGGLGRAQRDIGIALQLRLLIGVERRQRDPHADCAGQLVVVDQQRFVHRQDQQLGQTHRVIAGIIAADRDGEFIAAQSRNNRLAPAKSTFADDRTQPRGELPQKLITHWVTVQVINVFEVVDVEQQQGDVFADRKSTRLNSSHLRLSRMPSSA